MRILILGGDGYLGWPTAMHFASLGNEVHVIDNYLRRNIAQETGSEALISTPNLVDRADIYENKSKNKINVTIGDCADFRILEGLVKSFKPEVVIHYAEQPSAPYSMMGFEEAQCTLNNNLSVTFNLIWAVLEHAPDCHIVKLGTMGEYGTPNIDIEEGWLEIEHKGRKDKFLYPRAAGSLYHTTKVLDTDLLWFYVRIYGLKVTDLMQGPVYGIVTDQSELDPRLVPNFHYDDIFGTVLNRFLVQAISGVPLTIYGKGEQTRGYLNIKDTLQCVELAVRHPASHGELNIFNQFSELFSVKELANKVKRVGDVMNLEVEVSHIENPRKEKEDHYYNVTNEGFDKLGFKPCLLTDDVIAGMLEKIGSNKELIDKRKILPRVSWSN